MWRNDTKCKCMFIFPLKNLACKGLNPCGIQKLVLSTHYGLVMIWWLRSTLAQLIVCCLIAANHVQHQCWLILNGGSLVFSWEQFHVNCKMIWMWKWVWKLYFSGMDTKSNIHTCAFEIISTSSEANGLTHWGRDKMAAISQTAFSNSFSSMKIYEFP